MKKILLIPDSFKGTLSSIQVCGIMRRELAKVFPGAEILSLPVADGGEGSVDAFLEALGGEKRRVCVKGPFLEELEAFYGVLPDGKTAVIEMAACAGLPLVEGRANPSETSTYGVGELMLHAAESGCTTILLGLGGSCTNDGGVGAAAAAGIRFLDRAGTAFLPVGGTLDRIDRIDSSGLNGSLKKAAITVMCDIDNPLTGPQGAAAVFAPQKGADEKMVQRLDDNLNALRAVVQRQAEGQTDFSLLPGAGAAGGMGFGMTAFFHAPLKMGIETVLDTVQFDALLENADLVFTGEGRLDSQSARGKVVSGVCARAVQRQVPVLAVVGQIGEGAELLYEQGLSAVFSINTAPVDFSVAKTHAAKNLAVTMENLARLLGIGIR